MPCRALLRFAATLLSLCAAAAHAEPAVPVAGARFTPDARFAASWVLAVAEHRSRPFVIVDKREATMHVFDGAGRLVGVSPVLLGQMPGDTEPPGAAFRHPATLTLNERITPAGRFASVPGHNDKGEAVVWFDYAAGLAIHRLRPAPPQQQRPARLESATPDDNRISLGCIVVPVVFYDSVVAPLLGRQRGVVYVLPETQPVQALFGAFDVGWAAAH